jgi:hypothetical protein
MNAHLARAVEVFLDAFEVFDRGVDEVLEHVGPDAASKEAALAEIAMFLVNHGKERCLARGIDPGKIEAELDGYLRGRAAMLAQKDKLAAGEAVLLHHFGKGSS